MTADLARVEKIFTDALVKADANQRTEFLNTACNGDVELRERVEALLASYADAGSFLELPATEATALYAPLVERPGTMIGRYKLLEQIGEGGFGVIFMAEQEKPVRRRVALKIIKLGMDTKQVVARFEAERQALAMMDHPHIAKVLDAGATDTGRPYFVMELVRGVPITTYCDEARLTTDERLALFQSVCAAVQHAHQKGIIHRDLKPSNVLVTLHDDKAVPKVIDFGVAKATQGRLTERTLFTEFRQMVGTPTYMSPEQAQMSGLDVDTRSDIYSLGVLLYELLTGTTPIDSKQVASATYDDLRRLICEVEPPKPSARLSTLPNEQLTTLARQRQCEPAQLAVSLRSDLDWIVLRCLEKDRTRRYETANELSRDIDRYLRDEPVHACPPSASYRFRKFARRNKPVLATAAIVSTALLLATAVSIWQAAVARRAETLAESRLEAETQARQEAQTAERRATAEAVRSGQIAQFMKEMLKGVGPGVAMGQDTTLLRGILDETAKRLKDELAGQPEVEADLYGTLGVVYRDLGEYSSAEAMFERSLDLRRGIHGPNHLAVANSLQNLAEVYWLQYRNAEAEATFREALAMRRQLLGPEHLEVADSLHGLAEVLRRDATTREEAETLYRESIAIRRKLLGSESLEVATSLTSLGILLRNLSARQSDAESCIREALDIRRKILGPEHPDVAYTLCNLGYLLMKSMPAKRDEGESLLREALAIQKKVLGDHRDTAMTLYFLGSMVEDPAEAETFHREALEMRRKVLRPGHTDVMRSYSSLIALLKDQGRSTETAEIMRQELDWRGQDESGEQVLDEDYLLALIDILITAEKYAEVEALIRDAPIALDAEQLNGRLYNLRESGHIPEALPLEQAHLEHQIKWHGRNSREAILVMIRFSDDLRNSSNGQADAEEVAREALSIAKGLYGPNHELTGTAYGAVGSALWSQHRWNEAEEAFREQLRIAEGSELSKSPDDMYWIHWHLATSLDGQSRLSEAEELLRKAVEERDQVRSDAGPQMIRAVYVLADNLRAQDKLAEAEAVYREELERRQEEPDPRELVDGKDFETANLQLRLGSLLLERGKQEEAKALIEEGVKKADPQALNEVAWSLATDPDAEHRHGAIAVQLAEKAVEETDRKNPGIVDTLAAAYAAMGEFTEAVRLQREAIALLSEDNESIREDLESRLQLYEADLPYRNHNALAWKASALLETGKPAEAEPIAHECLVLREQLIPDDWRTFNIRSVLGGSLFRQEKYDDAEPLLLSGYEGMIEREADIPGAGKVRLTEALQRLVEFYETRNADGDAAKAEEYRRLLDDPSPANRP